jgi:hypothetical protein
MFYYRAGQNCNLPSWLPPLTSDDIGQDSLVLLHAHGTTGILPEPRGFHAEVALMPSHRWQKDRPLSL